MPETPLRSGATDVPNAPQSSIDVNIESAERAGYPAYRQVNGPKGPINFPARMSDGEVTAAMRKLYPPKQAPTAPESDMWAKVGSYIPEAATGPLAWGQKYLVEPFEKMAAKGAEIGAMKAPPAQPTPGVEIYKPPAWAAGVSKGIGETIGGMVADPRNWPLLGASEARPLIQKIMTRGFQAMMSKGSYDAATDLHDNWDKYTPEQRAERATQAGITASMTAMLFRGGHPAATPEDTSIAASGKTEAELKTEANIFTPSRKTGLTAEQIKTRIAALEQKIAAEKKVPPKAEDEVEAIRRGAPAEPVKPAPLPNQVLEAGVEPASKQIVKAEQEKMAQRIEGRTIEKKALEAPLPKAPEARPEPAPVDLEVKPLSVQEKLAQIKLQAMRELGEEGVNILKARGTMPPPEVPSTRLEERQAEMKAKQQAQASKVEDLLKQLPGRQAREATKRAEMGGEFAPPEAAKPDVKPVQAAGEAAKPREPVPSAEVAKIGEPEIIPPGARPRIVRGDEKGLALGQREPQPPVVKKELNITERLALQKERVAELQKKYPNIAKTRIQEMAAEQIKKEQGIVGGGGRDPAQRRADREAKIQMWLDRIKDPNVPLDRATEAYKMLNAYGVDKDEVIRRVSGAQSFAEKGDRLPEPSKEALEERIGPNLREEELKERLGGTIDELMGVVDKRFEEQGIKPLSEDIRAGLPGEQEIPGVKSPDVEELERTAGLKDPRKAEREDERGSISFKRISKEEQERANPLHRLADALDRVAGFFEHRNLSPEEIQRQQSAKNIIRGAGAELARSHLEVMQALDKAIERHDSPVNERENFVSFMDAGEGKPGAEFLNHEDQALAGALHDMFEERWAKVAEVKGLEGEGIENYLSHIWEKPGKAYTTLQGILQGKRPLEGSARFLKNRFYQYASEGVDHGLTPITWNPIRLQLAALFDTDRFLMAHDIKDQFKDAGLVQWHKLSEYKNVPPNWQKLNDKIFNPRAMGEGALKEYGTYYAPPEVAKIFNRYLSPGLGSSPIFQHVRNYGNTLNMVNLGVSGYHGTMVTLVSATSDLALGLQKAMNYGDIKGGTKDMLRGTLGTFIVRSAARDFALGRDIQAQAIDPTSNPALQKYVDMITKAGGRFKQDPFYSNSMIERKGFMNWLKLAPQGKFLQMAQTGVRAAAGPIMEKFVPRVKLGAASRMMEAKLDNLRQNGVTDEYTVATELGKIWDSIDNRAGQMVYDNLFWNKAIKDLSLVSIRAVGWDLGSLREYGGGALIDLPRQLAKGLRGERPELTSRIAFTIATPITIGLVGGMLHYMMTGKAPQQTEDYFYPGPEGGKVSFPSYMKDYFGFTHDMPKSVFSTVVNKLHPSISQAVDLYQNSDFYGTEIVHPGDDKLKQGYDILKWYGQSWEPLSYKGITKRIERGEPVASSVSGYLGFMPAPGYVGQSKAERLAVDLASREWKKGPRTSNDAERYSLVQKYQHQVGLGQKIDMSQLTKDWQDKRIQDADIAKIYSNYKVPKLQRDFKELPLPDALAVMREADPNERVQLKPLLLEKYGQLERYPLDAQQAYDREIRAYLK